MVSEVMRLGKWIVNTAGTTWLRRVKSIQLDVAAGPELERERK
jgi:hypothetical protein